jgi:AcrR family transcriptional regulator
MSRTGPPEKARRPGKPVKRSAEPSPRAGGAATADAASAGEALSRRAEKSAARREAILAAAIEEFSARGFAATRLDDVAQRAGVAKGTIYLHFEDKEALFQDIVRTMVVPFIAHIEVASASDLPIRIVVERMLDLFVHEIYLTKRRDVLRLVMTEGPRFPRLAEFYYHQVVERAIAAARKLFEQAHARGELRSDALVRFPQLAIAPGLVAIIWSGLFDRFAPLDVAALMRTHLDLLFGGNSAGGAP